MANCGLIKDPKPHFRDLALLTKELCQFGKINRLPLGLLNQRSNTEPTSLMESYEVINVTESDFKHEIFYTNKSNRAAVK